MTSMMALIRSRLAHLVACVVTFWPYIISKLSYLQLPTYLEWWRDSCVSGRRKRLACRINWCFALTFDLTEVNRRKMMYCWLLSYPAVLPGCGTTGTGNWGLGLCHRATRKWNLIGLELLVCLENWMGQYQFFWRWIACAWLVAKLDTCMAKANKKILRKLGYFWLKSLKLNLPHPPTPYMLELI